MKAIPLSAGLALGTVFLHKDREQEYRRSICPGEVESEISRFRSGRNRAAASLEKLIEKVRREVGDSEAEIFEGHLEILTSEDLEEEVVERITSSLVGAEQAVMDFAEENAAEMEELESEYFRERGQDFRDIGTQLAAAVAGKQTETAPLPSDAVVAAEELTPSQTAHLDLSRVRGFIIRRGGRNSHAAIMARSLEIPAVILEDQGDFTSLEPGEEIFLNGYSGEVILRPSREEKKVIAASLEKEEEKRKDLLTYAELPAETVDHQRVKLYANVGGEHDFAMAARYNADGIGLFRTEFLFMESSGFPGLERQISAYAGASRALQGREVIIRLLDTGADKPLPYWPLAQEENPFLGIRGIRLLLQKEEVLRTQIQALLKASATGPLGMMIPMVGSLRVIDRVRELLEEEKAALNIPGDNLKMGVMIETPAAVFLIEEILDLVDFVSVGTNDLTQYTLAVDRGNPALADYYEEFHPAVVRSLAMVARGCRKKGKPSGICGEMGGSLLALPLLVGLGIDELSMSSSKLLEAKKLIRRLDHKEARDLAEELVLLPTAGQIKDRLTSFCRERNLLP